jgi:hypothetical protein
MEPSTKVQPKWQRVILLSVLGYEGAGCLAGGGMLIAQHDGHLMKMPVSLMHGAFPNFLIPGIILFLLGILNSIAFMAVLHRRNADWFWAGLATGGLLIWFWVEIAILLELHWLHAMWGLPVVLGTIMAVLLYASPYALRKGALICGILSSVLYVAVNIIVPAQWPEYSSMSFTVSELSAVHAPTRFLWNVLCTPYTLLMLAFAWGVWKLSEGNKRLRIAGKLLMVYSSLGLLWPFAPMHLRETLAAGGGTFSDTMHLTLATITEIIYLFALGFAAAALDRKFRIYSIITLILLSIFGTLTFLEAPNVSKNLPTPFIGLWERINIGLFLQWVIVLALILLGKLRTGKQLS